MPHNLSYPEDVTTDGQQGHYIMFMINETTPGKVGKRANRAPARFGTLDEQAAANFPRDQKIDAERAKLVFIDKHLNSGSAKATSTVVTAPSKAGLAWRPGTTRMSQAITLYMPPSVKVNYKSNYKHDDIGFVASGISAGTVGVIQGFTQGGSWLEKLGGAAAEGGKSVIEGSVAFAADKIMKLADTFAPGATTLAQLSTGAILGSKMEVMFTDVGRRDFSFQFNFIPKSEKESKTIFDIVQTFKEHMLPEYLAKIDLTSHGMGTWASMELGQGRILKIPNTFDIHYFFHHNENPFLNRISTCYLTSMDVEYGGEKYVTYEPTTLGYRVGPPPQRTAITLSFTEIETITRERAKQGF